MAATSASRRADGNATCHYSAKSKQLGESAALNQNLCSFPTEIVKKISCLLILANKAREADLTPMINDSGKN